ncbi:MAG: PDZ domain-containing protein [Planctomycetia bacterium]|jgi:membrane-associated protease RseP (regulator of RpoE activity)
MTRSRAWYVQLAFGFLAMLASMGLVDRYITPAVAATHVIDSTAVDQGDTRAVPAKSGPTATPLMVPLGHTKVKPVPGRMAPKLPKYWIGVHCYGPLPPVLRAHVKVPEGQGIMVLDVVEKGPGDKAGLQPNDILLNIGEKPLRSAQDLVMAVEKSKGKPIEIGLLRGGKPISLTVDPEKRPKEAPHRPTLPSGHMSPDMELFQHWFEQAQPGQGVKPPMRFRFFHPGMILPPDVSLHPGLPSGLSITITREGKAPAQITVKRYATKDKKEETWELDENQLDDLPNDIRPHVERMLNGVIAGAMPQFDFMPTPDMDPNSPAPMNNDVMRKQMQQMQKQMKQMEKMMDLMRQQMRNP